MPRTRRHARRIRVNGAFGRILAFGPLHIPVVFIDPTADNTLRAGRVVVDADGSVHSVADTVIRDDGATVAANATIARRVVTPSREVLMDEAALWAAIGQPDGLTPLTTFVDASVLTDGTYSIMRSLTLAPGSVVGTTLRPNEAASYALGVLFAALARENALALTQIIFEGSPRFVAIQPDGGVALLRYASEATAFPPTLVADVVEAADAILYARMLVAGRKNNTAPSLIDTSGAQIAAVAATTVAELSDTPGPPLLTAIPVDIDVPASRLAVDDTLRTMPTLLGVAGVGVPVADPFRRTTRARRRPLLGDVSSDPAYDDRATTLTVDPF